MPSPYKALNDASRLAHAELTGASPKPEDQAWETKEITVSCEIHQDQLDRLRAVYPEMSEAQLVRECLAVQLLAQVTDRDNWWEMACERVLDLGEDDEVPYPSIYDVFEALGVPREEFSRLTGEG